MSENKAPQAQDLSKLTRQQLRELEEKEKTKGQILFDRFMVILPIICGIIACLEYMLVPDNSPNSSPYTYLTFLIIASCAYLVYLVFAKAKKSGGDKTVMDNLRYRAP